jgi:hypothetical protein
VRVTNETGPDIGVAFAELLRLQAEFQTRLTEETLNHLRRLQGAAMPVAPATVLLPGGDAELRAAGSPGTTTELWLELDNRQRVHCVVTPMLSPLVEASGVTWFPSTTDSVLLLAPDEVVRANISLRVPDEIPVGIYRGALLLHGFHAGALAVVIQVTNKASAPEPASAAKKRSRGAAAAKKKVSGKSRKAKSKNVA